VCWSFCALRPFCAQFCSSWTPLCSSWEAVLLVADVVAGTILCAVGAVLLVVFLFVDAVCLSDGRRGRRSARRFARGRRAARRGRQFWSSCDTLLLLDTVMDAVLLVMGAVLLRSARLGKPFWTSSRAPFCASWAPFCSLRTSCLSWTLVWSSFAMWTRHGRAVLLAVVLTPF
jgi:hypothetical protein